MSRSMLTPLVVVYALLAHDACAQVDILERFAGRNLEELSFDAMTPLRELVRVDEDKSDTWPMPLTTPKYVWRFPLGDKNGFVVFEGQSLIIVPGEASAVIHLFDSTGRVISQSRFSTGWRLLQGKASFGESSELDTQVIVLHTLPAIAGPDISKQYYAFNGKQFHLVRMEDHKGCLVQNRYSYPNYTIGVTLPSNRKHEWIKMLASPNQVDVLAALTFVGGDHVKVAELESKADHRLEKPEQVELVRDLRNCCRVRELVERHSRSTNEWIREAAGLTKREVEFGKSRN